MPAGGRYQGGRGRGREGPSFEDPEDLIFGKVLRGHEDGITALVVNDAAGQVLNCQPWGAAHDALSL